MKKSLLIIATLFFIQFGYSQKHSGQAMYKNDDHGNYSNRNTIHNSNYHHNKHLTYETSHRKKVNYHSPRKSHANHSEIRSMSHQELNSVINAIRNEAFSSNKLSVARQANQVVEIGKLFAFESDRLDFAKMAYNNTVDKQNYYLVNSIFHFSSSKRELNNFIHDNT